MVIINQSCDRSGALRFLQEEKPSSVKVGPVAGLLSVFTWIPPIGGGNNQQDRNPRIKQLPNYETVYLNINKKH